MSQPQGTGDLVEILTDRLAAEAVEPTPYALLQAPDGRAQLVAGLRAIADWFEQHTEIAPPTYPDFTVSVGQSGEWTTNDAEGRARMEAFAAAIGSELHVSDHLDVEREFGSVKLRAYFITQAARSNS